MIACIGEPISWLRMERYQLNELPEAERSEIARHLEACPSCGSCFQHVAAERELPPLPLPAAKPRARWSWRWPAFWGWASLGVASAAALLMVLRPEQVPAARLRAKGGEFALELVRLDADGQQRDASKFSASDRFKVLLTCPPNWRGHAQLAIYQAGQAYFPLPDEHIDTCGNRLNLPGAFQLDGASPVTVCVALSDNALETTKLAGGVSALPELSVCAALEPAGD